MSEKVVNNMNPDFENMSFDDMQRWKSSKPSVHPAVKTGRIKSKKPNKSNIPKREAQSEPMPPERAVLYNHVHLTDVFETKRPLVLIDLDNTLVSLKWDGVQNYRPDVLGSPLKGMAELCHRLMNEGFDLELYTARLNIVSYWIPDEDRTIGRYDIAEAIRKWLSENNFPKITVPTPQRTMRPKYNCLALIDDNCVNPKFVSPDGIFQFCLDQRVKFIKGLERNILSEELS